MQTRGTLLKIRPAWKADKFKRFGELEEKYHYMGETHSGGDTLRLVIEDDGEWVAIMVWGGACYHLLRRDEYIGWTPSLRAQRLKLIATNMHFTILAKPGERKNLASQCLALAAREIAGLWVREFHYRPLLAETFCDIEHSAGTCYKAAGWTPLGMTKGFTRVNRQECYFYVPNEGTHPRQLALDGKFVKEVMGIVSVVNVENGAPVAVAVCSRNDSCSLQEANPGVYSGEVFTLEKPRLRIIPGNDHVVGVGARGWIDVGNGNTHAEQRRIGVLHCYLQLRILSEFRRTNCLLQLFARKRMLILFPPPPFATFPYSSWLPTTTSFSTVRPSRALPFGKNRSKMSR